MFWWFRCGHTGVHICVELICPCSLLFHGKLSCWVKITENHNLSFVTPVTTAFANQGQIGHAEVYLWCSFSCQILCSKKCQNTAILTKFEIGVAVCTPFAAQNQIWRGRVNQWCIVPRQIFRLPRCLLSPLWGEKLFYTVICTKFYLALRAPVLIPVCLLGLNLAYKSRPMVYASTPNSIWIGSVCFSRRAKKTNLVVFSNSTFYETSALKPGPLATELV